MTKLPDTTRLTSLQLELLKVYSIHPSEEELLELKRFLAKMFWKKLTSAVETAAQSRNLSSEDLDKWLEDEDQ